MKCLNVHPLGSPPLRPNLAAHPPHHTCIRLCLLQPSVGPQGKQLLSFLPGQWVDFFIPGLPVAGGFSFVSTPCQLEQEGTFELAVKHSTHPPAAWMHEQVGGQCAGCNSRGCGS